MGRPYPVWKVSDLNDYSHAKEYAKRAEEQAARMMEANLIAEYGVEGLRRMREEEAASMAQKVYFIYSSRVITFILEHLLLVFIFCLCML